MSRHPEENQMSPLPDTAGTIKCGSCKSRHFTAYDVLACYVAAGLIKDAWPCGWGMLAQGEDGPYTIFCDAPARARADGTGYDCILGHEHTTAEARRQQGWDYASDLGEAELLAKYGTEPRTMTGQIWPA